MTPRAHPFPNTHILLRPFDYVRPGSLEEALEVLKAMPTARMLAGGTNLLVDMKLERCTPSCLIDISQLSELKGIRASSSDGLQVGALTTLREIAWSEALRRDHTCLAEAADAFGSTQIMMRGTLGGNIANGSPASDTVPALLVLGAEAQIVNPEGERTCLVADLLQAPGRIQLSSGEILSSVRIPTPQAGTGSCFLKLSRVRADLAKVSVAVRLVRQDSKVVGARIALGSVGPTVIRAKKASSMLSGRTFTKDLALHAARLAAEEIAPIDDVRSSADYRRRAGVALVHDALTVAWQRADGLSIPSPRRTPALVESAPLPSSPDGVVVSAGDIRAIDLQVNEQWVEIDVSPNELLLNVLRERLELTGAKYGCGIGECGACTVLLDSVPVLACLVLAISAQGRSVQTVEGLASSNGTLDPLQEAFIEENAFQCGYCTPGMLMMTKKLIEEIPQPTEEEIRDYLKGNHCRCTGYASIVRAVHKASESGGASP
jgi:xanthine dehydrogenase iron-sulfur cluster and FAD-binding subunit A